MKVEMTVSPDGTVRKTRVVGGNALLANAALEAARSWNTSLARKETVELATSVFDTAANSASGAIS